MIISRRSVLVRLFVAVILGAVVYSTLMVGEQRSDYAVELSAERIVHPSPSSEPRYHCKHQTLGGLLMADSDGYVCERFNVNARSHCCDPEKARDHRSCFSCVQVAQLRDRVCCEFYEYCISCCLYDSAPPSDYNQTEAQFVACAHTCRTGSSTLDKHGHYANGTHRYCLPAAPFVPETPSPSPSASASPSVAPDRDGIVWVHL